MPDDDSIQRRERGVGRLTSVAGLLVIFVAVSATAYFATLGQRQVDETASEPAEGPATSDGASRQRNLGQLHVSPANGQQRGQTRHGNLVTNKVHAQVDSQRALLDPRNDGWVTEAVAATFSQHLSDLAEHLASDESELTESIDSIVKRESGCETLLPRQLDVIFQDGYVRVKRPSELEPPQQTGTPITLGAAIGQLHERLRSVRQRRVNLKVIRIHAQDKSDHVSADVLYQASGTTAAGRWQQNALWTTSWSRANPVEESRWEDSAWRLVSIASSEFEEIETTQNSNRRSLHEGSRDGSWLVDQTKRVFAESPSFRNQLSRGAGYWMRRLPAYISPRLLEGHIGITVGDVNEDGLDDLYVCQPGGLPNRLLIQNPDGTVRDVSHQAGVDLLDWSYSSLMVDLDNDGHQDLVILADSRLLIFAGNGTGDFRRCAAFESSCEYALSAADFDGDGDLDLYACNYFAESADGLAQLRRTDPLIDSNTGGRNVLFRNNGQWSFDDATDEVGLDVHNRRWSLAATWEDYDNDGDVDLYVVNDFGHNCLYRNTAGRFQELAVEAGVVDANQGMSASWSDFDRDGWMDIYVSNMFSAAGNRVTLQPQFLTSESETTRRKYQQLARGNTLLRNTPSGTFDDVSQVMRVTMGRWAWASLFADLNNDGWDDLLVANGYLTQDDDRDL